MATITKRASGLWQAKVRRRGHPAQSRTFESRADAVAWARAVEREMDIGTYVPADTAQRTILREVLERYSYEVLPRLSRGAKPDKSRISRLCGDLGHINLAALDSAQVARYRDMRLRDGAAPQTVKHELGLLNRVLKHYVIDWGIYLPRGVVTTQVRKPTLPEGRTRRLRPGEEKLLLTTAAKARSKDLCDIIKVALGTGARRGEIAAMKWADLGTETGVWHIPEAKCGARSVPVPSAVMEVLRTRPRRIDGRVWAIGREDGITQAFNRLCRRLDIHDLTFHDLRHEATSRFFEMGLNVMEVAAITGHKDLRVLRRYTHLKAEDLAKKINSIVEL